MACVAKKCGIRFKPPSIILIYEEKDKEKTRQRIMPVRNFSKFSGVVCLLAACPQSPPHPEEEQLVSNTIFSYCWVALHLLAGSAQQVGFG